ncbi:hypothetical protein CEE37_09320 [candidate division LCP-89 bacterium B3_LCP]|uniref:TonB-dependent receptor plug domain-containing protein n=1 Tax=candidate division LCP-89 bacterium B3_LCP TaxID=2012998 RepID=A0A532UYU7_UNCL8|nr:MAG: hypothetical protein CEE37_09320 [candidate division LCP-89 bacterium B3_LCP]
MKLWCKCLIVLVLLSGTSVSAQIKNPIRGFVVDATSSETLPAANVVIEGTQRGASTNLDGYFVLSNMYPGTYYLVTSYLGYHPKTTAIEVTEDLMEPIRVELVPLSMQLEEVVYALENVKEKEARLSPKVSVIPVDVGTIRKMPSLGGEMDVLRTLQMLPGVKASSDISSALYVRGGSPDQTLILMDHNVVYNPSHMFGLFSTFNADAVKHIELMKGGFPAEYGGRSGSVLDVITNEGNRKETEGMFSIGLISSKAALEGPLPGNKGSYAVSGRRTYMEPILDLMRSMDEDLDLPNYYFYDANGKVNLDLTKKTTLSMAGYFGEDNFIMNTGPKDSPINFGLNWGNRTFSTRLRHVLSRDMFFSLGAAVSRYRSEWLFENDGVVLEEAYDRLYDYSLKSDLEYYGLDNHKIKTGLWLSYYDFELDIFNEEQTWVDIHDGTYNLSLYLQDSWRVHPMFEIQPGLRSYYHQGRDEHRFDPRLALVLHYDTNMRFKLAGGRYTQWINLITFGEGMSSFDIWSPVDETMDPTYCDQIVLGYEWEPAEDLEFTAETYYTDMNNVQSFNMLTSDPSYDGSTAFIEGEGNAYGAEWMLRRKTGNLTGWIGYSLSWTKRRYPDTYQNNGEWYYPKWDRRHDFLATAMYELNHRWDFSCSWRYNTGQGFTQPIGITTTQMAGIDPDYMTGSGRMVINGSMNNYRFPADHRMDLTATWKHRIFGQPAKLILSVYNLYNRRSYWMRVTNTNENPVEITDIKLLPILPLISYEVRF